MELLASLSQEDSILRFFNAGQKVAGEFKVWGDFSALCFWTAGRGRSYGYLFGKKQGLMLGIREDGKQGVRVFEVGRFAPPVEAQAGGCAVLGGRVYFGGDSGVLYFLEAGETGVPAKSTATVEFGKEVKGVEV